MEYNQNDNISLRELFEALFNRKAFIGVVTCSFTILSIITAIHLPDIYTSKSILIPSTDEESLSSKLGSFSSLATLGGINMSAVRTSKSQEAIERIKSFEFFSTYFLPNIKLEDIFAVDRWVSEENILIYDPRLYDKDNSKWVRKANSPKGIVPSAQEAFKIYSEIVSVNENTTSSFVTISVDHYSPVIAKKWVDLIIYQINESMRKNDEDTAKKSITYLNDEFQYTNITSIKEVISNLLQDQMQTLMLTASSESYVFKIIDSPVVAEEKSKPSRVLMVFLGTFLGIISSLLIVTFQHYRLSTRT